MLDIIVAVVIGIMTGIVSGMGFGGGTILIIYLTVILGMPQIVSQGINLIYFIPTAAIAIIAHLKAHRIEKNGVVFLTSFSVIGAITGSLIAGILDSQQLKKLFSVGLLILGVYELIKEIKHWRKDKKENYK